mmetsp:Transcript_110174/g.284697  ORF Transcript_110174/g.284697 Transcript_110174/m.284697 type:complete len:217 (+) Transcript_110174:223-873(+)
MEGLIGSAAQTALMASKNGNFKKFVASVVLKKSSIICGLTSLMASLIFIRFTNTRFTIGSPTADSAAWITEATAPAPMALMTLTPMPARAGDAAAFLAMCSSAPAFDKKPRAPDTNCCDCICWDKSDEVSGESAGAAKAVRTSASAKSEVWTSGKSCTAKTARATAMKRRPPRRPDAARLLAVPFDMLPTSLTLWSRTALRRPSVRRANTARAKMA